MNNTLISKWLIVLCVFWSLNSQARIDTVSVFSNSMQKFSECVVVLPESYSETDEHFPVLYLLHGYGGNQFSWLELDENLPAKATSFGMIIVCPDGGYRSWYIDSPVDSTMRYETHIVGEIVPYIDSHYRTIGTRSARAITGLSMGGHGGIYLGVRNSSVFGAAGSSSGGVDIRQFTSSWELKEKILGDTLCCKTNWENHTVYNVIDRLKPGELQLIVDCGLEDFFLDVNRSLHQKLLMMNIMHDYIERPGAHNSEYWRNSIDYQMLYFAKFFRNSMSASPKVNKH
jgi:S-formylglutathione hydrolase FrmB